MARVLHKFPGFSYYGCLFRKFSLNLSMFERFIRISIEIKNISIQILVRWFPKSHKRQCANIGVLLETCSSRIGQSVSRQKGRRHDLRAAVLCLLFSQADTSISSSLPFLLSLLPAYLAAERRSKQAFSTLLGCELTVLVTLWRRNWIWQLSSEEEN